MPLTLQLHLVMMSKHSKFGVTPFILFELWATLKFLHDNKDDVQQYNDHNSSTFFFETGKQKLVLNQAHFLTNDQLFPIKEFTT